MITAIKPRDVREVAPAPKLMQFGHPTSNATQPGCLKDRL